MGSSKHRNWLNIAFFSIVPPLGIVGTVLLCVFSMVSWQTWLLTIVMILLTGLSITAGYHRLFSHRTYEAAKPVQWFFALFGAASFEGSVLEWSMDHRAHHRYTDTPRDPYNIKQGFWHAHMGWLLSLDPSTRDFSTVADLQQRWILRFQHRYFSGVAILMGLVLPTLIASLWGEALAGFIVAGLLRITFVHQGTFFINSLCHILGSRDFCKKTSACDNWLSAFVTMGEGYHNYHHTFPRDYRNGIRFYHFDPSKWLIFALSKLGLATQLRRTAKYRIIQARVDANCQQFAEKTQLPALVQLREAMMQHIAKIKGFEAAYAESKLKRYRRDIRQATRELAELFSQWKAQLVAV